jgi:hypothetical protein
MMPMVKINEGETMRKCNQAGDNFQEERGGRRGIWEKPQEALFYT